jgi:hypothetical protein
MTTQAQIAANRRNARKSTGPVTEAGKAAASQNALRHGLTARQIASTDERSADFAEFAAALRLDLAPEGEVEEQLAERVILAAWRLRRAARAERGVIATWAVETSPSFLRHGETTASRIFTRHPESILALARYEATQDRAFGRALALLERRQARRRGEHVPVPLTVVVENAAAASPNPFDANVKFENCETKPIAAAPLIDALAAPRAKDADTAPDAALCAASSA